MPSDSISEHYAFERGNDGIQQVLDDEWERGQFYLGEWHTHPLQQFPHPSDIDIDGTQEFLKTTKNDEDVSILFILSPNGEEGGWNFDGSIVCPDDVHPLIEIEASA